MNDFYRIKNMSILRQKMFPPTGYNSLADSNQVIYTFLKQLNPIITDFMS